MVVEAYEDRRPLEGLSPGLSEPWVLRGLLAAIGAIGIGIGVFAFNTSSKVAGTICLLTNIPVLAYYGFIVGYVSLGGSEVRQSASVGATDRCNA
jgi:hypothetical protein